MVIVRLKTRCMRAYVVCKNCLHNLVIMMFFTVLFPAVTIDLFEVKEVRTGEQALACKVRDESFTLILCL